MSTKTIDVQYLRRQRAQVGFVCSKLPESRIQHYIQIGSSRSRLNWELGDSANSDVAYFQELGFGVSVMAIYAAISELSGVSARTVRHYAALAEFYPEPVRDQFAALSFDHFATARTYGARWQELLEFCLSYAEVSGGRPASVDVMEQFAQGRIEVIQDEHSTAVYETPELPDDIASLDPDVDVHIMADDEPAIPEGGIKQMTRWEVQLFTGKFDRFIKAVMQAVDRLPVDEDAKDELSEAILSLSGLVYEILGVDTAK